MAKVRVHPIQQAFTVTDDAQVCDLCGAEEFWTATTIPAVPGGVITRSVHLVHLVREHLADVERANSAAGLAEEITVEIEE